MTETVRQIAERLAEEMEVPSYKDELEVAVREGVQEGLRRATEAICQIHVMSVDVKSVAYCQGVNDALEAMNRLKSDAAAPPG
jgi:CBS-domain-containing membrane protein